jgi:hypothetical protein
MFVVDNMDYSIPILLDRYWVKRGQKHVAFKRSLADMIYTKWVTNKKHAVSMSPAELLYEDEYEYFANMKYLKFAYLCSLIRTWIALYGDAPLLPHLAQYRADKLLEFSDYVTSLLRE